MSRQPFSAFSSVGEVWVLILILMLTQPLTELELEPSFTKSKAAEVFLPFTVGLSTGLWHEINMSQTCMHVQIVRSLGV